MLTPIEIKRKSFKNGGFGYEKREVDLFLEEVQKDYEKLYKENVEYKDKINVLSDGLQYYKSIEKTLQKALVLAQRTADESHADAVKKADAIEKEAHLKAEQILQEARRELERIHTQAEELVRSYDNYKANLRSMLNAQLEFMDSSSMKAASVDIESFLRMEKPLKDLKIEEHEASMDEAAYDNEEETPKINLEDTMNLEELAKIKEQIAEVEENDED